MTDSDTDGDDYDTKTDMVPEFFNFVRSLQPHDLVAELLQNEIDAGSTHTILDFAADQLICSGNGAPVDENGWKRLTYLRGAGDEVPQKKGLIGIKNHGLKACFTIGDSIHIRSGRLKTDQTLYKNGEDKPPKPGARRKPLPDPDGPGIGCTIEVPYRRRELVYTAGERVVLDALSEDAIAVIFANAVKSLAGRFIGTLRPDVRPRHLIELRHHKLGTTSFSFSTTRMLSKGKLQAFLRNCEISGPGGDSVLRERVATRTMVRPRGPQHDVPDFYARKRRLVIEVAWTESQRGRIVTGRGELRYPIAYVPDGSSSSSSGFAAHYSAPYASNTERHGLAGLSNSWNDYLTAGCDGLLVDAISWLLDRADLRPLDLLGADFAPDDRLAPLIVALAKNHALPSIPPRAKSGRVKSSAQRRWTRILIPSTNAHPGVHSDSLADVAPPDEWLLATTAPERIRSLLLDPALAGWMENRISFDETDVADRLRPLDPQDERYFPWASDAERRRAMSNIPLVQRHLDALLDGDPIPSPADDIELPDTTGLATRLAQMSLASELPTDLPGVSLPPIIHPDLAAHPIFKSNDWRRPHFGFEELVESFTGAPISSAAAKRLFAWLAQNPSGFPKKAWPAIKELPIWPDASGTSGRLERLCEPKSGALGRVLTDALSRPHGDIAKLRTALAYRRLSLAVRDEPSAAEASNWLAHSLTDLTEGRVLDTGEVLRFRKLERDLETIAKSAGARLLAASDAPPALAKDGMLKARSELVSPVPGVERLFLLSEHVAATRSDLLSAIWPMRAVPTAAMVRAALGADLANKSALLGRLKALADDSETNDLGIGQFACIPIGNGFAAPVALAFKGNKGDYWGQYRRQISGKDLSPNDQALYRRAGVLAAEPNLDSSRTFFAWLRDDERRIEPHLPQIVRHFAHDRGATSWWGIYENELCLPVDSVRGIELVSHRTATRGRLVFVKDFPALAKTILEAAGSFMLAVDKHEQVTSSITQILLGQGVRSLRSVAGEPIKTTGTDPAPAPAWVQEILTSLKSKRIAKTLEKRLDDYQVDRKYIHAHWPSRLSGIESVICARNVFATFKIGQREITAEVDHAFDAVAGILWLKLEPDDQRSSVEGALFMAMAGRVFIEGAPLWCGPALAAALNTDIVEAKAAAEQKLDFEEPLDADDDPLDEHEPGDEDEPDEAPTGHYDWTTDPARNVPNPGPLPENDSKPAPEKPTEHGKDKKRERAVVPGEDDQIRDLKQNHYAFHCQISLASHAPAKLAPAGSYVELAENRAKMIDAHHVDYAGASGARHAGNLLILSHVEHHRVGRKLSREQVRKALKDVRPHQAVFGKGSQRKTVEGVVADVPISATGEIIPIFFTLEHRDYWLR
jgi:hypothetical protein